MASSLGTSRQIVIALSSVALGLWAFKTVNEISGPAFEPILTVCSDSSIPIDEFAEKTGYHTWEPRVGLGAFNVLVCLITQFLLELRNTYPAGFLTWFGVMVVAFPFGVASTVEAGRQGAKGLIRYPLILGLTYQLFGISVMVPLLWVPAYIYGRGKGGVSVTRALASIPMNIPSLALSCICFTADTDSYLWTVSAGILGGPLVIFICVFMWADSPPKIEAEAANDLGRQSVALAYRISLVVATILWFVWVYVAYSTYGTDVSSLWRAVWSEANASVAFMTIDTLVLFAGMLLYLSFRSASAALKTLVLTPLLGPGGACSYTMAELEEAMRLPSAKKDE